MLARKAAEFALSKKASDVIMMDLRKLNAPADFFVLCSADSDTHAKAIAQAVRNGTEDIGVAPWRSEGFRALSWVLLDYVDVVVHVFRKEARRFYNLERLWGDAKVVAIEDRLRVPITAAPSHHPAKRRTVTRSPKKVSS